MTLSSPHKLSPQIHLNRAKGYFQLEMFDDVEVELRAVEDVLPWSKEKREILTFVPGKKRVGIDAASGPKLTH